jgi:4-diphosphocytidyl-2-C-methyl-D-erythritol kinase
MRIRRVGPSLVVHTPAKLNLFLELLGKREDGYHELETLMVAVDLFDTLTFMEEDSNEIRLQCSGLGAARQESAPDGADRASTDAGGDGIPIGSDNLVAKAARLLREHAGVDRGIRIDLVKRIPSAAGLAGGSSDAAATLMALNRFWKLGLGIPELRRLASHLGSDVAFFVDGTSAAVCHGRGEIIEPLDVPLGLHFVIVRPRTGLSTAQVYKHAQVPAAKKSVHDLSAALRAGRKGLVGRLLHNRLQPPAERLNPEVQRLQTLFSRLPVVGHQMSGSGTAYFGLCDSARHAQSLAGRLRGARVGRVWVAQCRP